MRGDTSLPIIGVDAGELPEAMVVVGDPARAEKAAALLDDARPLARNREFVSFAGTYRGARVGVISHGVGASGAATCFEELCRGGVNRIVRSGTAGGMQPRVTDGDLAVATAAVRADGYTPGVVPEAYPAVPDRALTTRLVEAAGEAHEGIVLTSAVFYPHDIVGSDLALWQRAGVVAVEMEAAALFVVASLHGVAAGAVFAIDGNPLAEEDAGMSGYDPDREVVHRAVDRALRAAFTALT
ncbi:MAG: nucleoside phosphorylase [Actinomycetota bacterium]